VKQIHCGIGIPSPDTLSPEFALGNLPQIMSNAKKKGYKVSLLYKRGVRTDSNRNYILNEFLKTDVTHILWLDADMIYPVDIIDKLVSVDVDVIGSFYYKRQPPYHPVVYVLNGQKENPYRPVDLQGYSANHFEVDGVGYGGMLVKMDVYKSLGDDKWTTYGKNFHIPTATTDKQSHDLLMCETFKKHGYKIYVHNGVKCLHITDKAVGEADYLAETNKKPISDVSEPLLEKEIAVLMPSIWKEEGRGEVVCQQLMKRAGINADYFVLYGEKDKDDPGFIKKVNDFVNNTDYKYYVYTAYDAFAGRNWLKIAYNALEESGKGLFAFNDGKWYGRMAAFGMVRKEWASKLYGSGIFFDGYHSHYADVEISGIARKTDQLAIDLRSLLVEVDPDKDTKGTNLEDKKLFAERNPNAEIH